MAQPLEYTVELGLRWRDIDLLGHLNQSVYHELIEEARAGLLGELHQRLQDGLVHGGFVVRHVEIDHLHEVRRDHERVIVTARVAGVGNSSLRIAQELRLPDGTVAASALVVLVGWDMSGRGKREISAPERSLLTGQRSA